MFIVVDSFPEAQEFYAHYAFRDIPDHERMYIPITDVAKLIESASSQ